VDKFFDKTKQMTTLLRTTPVDFSKEFPYQLLMDKLAEFLGCDLFIVDSKRNFLGYHYSHTDKQNSNALKTFFNYQKLPESVAAATLAFYEINHNKKIEDSILAPVKEIAEYYSESSITVAPVYGSSLRIGTIFILSNNPLEVEQLILVEFLASIIGTQLSYLMLEELENKRRDNTLATLVGSLSRTELESFKAIIEKIEL